MFHSSSIISLPHHTEHLFEGRGDDRAAGLGAEKERVFVDFPRHMGVTNENEIDILVAPAQEEIEQLVKALGQVFHMLRHRAGDIHQTEHDGAGHGLGNQFKPIIANIDRVDEGNALITLPMKGELPGEFHAFLGAFGVVQFREPVDLRFEAGELGRVAAVSKRCGAPGCFSSSG